MATKSQRLFALFGAILFLGTSSALTIAVIISNVQSSHNKSSSGSQAASTTSKQANKLEGTQLQNFTPTSNVTSLQTTDIKEGTGETVKPGASIVVDYTGAVASTGTIFQSSLDSGQPVPLSLSGVIKGWAEGIPGMKVGGTRRLLIPADLAYGANPPTGIPANAPLVFDVTLHAISKN